MPANWSLILNVLVLIGVVVAIGRIMKARRESLSSERYKPTLGKVGNSPYDAQPMHDDIIAVRKVNSGGALVSEPELVVEPQKLKPKQSPPQLMPVEELYEKPVVQEQKVVPSMVMMFFKQYLLRVCALAKVIYFIAINFRMDKALFYVVWRLPRPAVFLICKI